MACDVVLDVAVGDDQVQPAVVVEVQPLLAEGDVRRARPDAQAWTSRRRRCPCPRCGRCTSARSGRSPRPDPACRRCRSRPSPCPCPRGRCRSRRKPCPAVTPTSANCRPCSGAGCRGPRRWRQRQALPPRAVVVGERHAQVLARRVIGAPDLGHVLELAAAQVAIQDARAPAGSSAGRRRSSSLTSCRAAGRCAGRRLA